MTFRSIILGLLGAVFVIVAGYLNDNLLQSTFFVGNHLPVSVFGLLVIFVIVINPLLGKLRSRFRPGELAVIITMTLAACAIPGSGLMRTFPTTLIMPLDYSRTRPHWQRDSGRIIDYVPSAMLPQIADESDPVVLDGYMYGLKDDPSQTIPLSKVPWRAWAGPLATWTPLLLLLGLAAICLSVIVHRQWSEREHLRYPVATFATTLMGGGKGSGRKPIYKERIFWWGLAIVLFIRVANGLWYWDNDTWIHIPTNINLWAVHQKWPELPRLLGFRSNYLVLPMYPTVIAFAFMLSSEVSFSLGITPILMALVTWAQLSYGVDISGDHAIGGVRNWTRFGAYLGMLILICYTGRRYYWQVLKQALLFRRQSEADSAAAWACRFLIFAVAGMVVILSALGLDWPFALLTVLLVLMMFLVMARINAETGMFFCQSWWQPVGVLVGLFGFVAMGPHAMATLAVFSSMVTLDPRECLMPFVINGLKICGDTRVSKAKAGWAAAGAFAVALVVAMVFVLWANYNYPAFEWDKWATVNAPNLTYQPIEKTVNDLDSWDKLEESKNYTTWERIKNMRPNPQFLGWAGAGLAAVLVVSALRLRLARFPLHPIIFLVWGTYPIQTFSFSFLVGWSIKYAVMKYGGTRTYRRVTAFMFGAIAGDLLGGLIFMVVPAIHYMITGVVSESYKYKVFPG